MKRISSKRFEALCYTRLPWETVRHYETNDGSNIATVEYNKVDNDFGYVILGRDKRNIFRCIDTCRSLYATANEAEIALKEAIRSYENDKKEKYFQGDEATPIQDILKPIISKEKMHEYFNILLTSDFHTGARRMIQEISYSFIDKDKNLVQEFQGQGFNQRLWEIFLYALFQKTKFDIDFTISSPDFSLLKHGKSVFVEAVTVGPNPDRDLIATSPMDVINLSDDYMPIKFGSALHSKMKKKYWELPHIKGHPFVIAIHDYHGPAIKPDTPGSMTWSRGGLESYLYGTREETIVEGNVARPRMIDGKNGPEISILDIEYHQHGGKTIPSRFFKQPESENVSAVLFSNGATISTFNRMGRLAGFSDDNAYMVRLGMRFNTETSKVEQFSINVDSEDYDESWGETVTMFHNPWAKHPIPLDMFEDISHIFYDLESGQFCSTYTPIHILTSMTHIIGKEG